MTSRAKQYNPFLQFFKGESSGGLVLFAAALLAIIAANTAAFSEWYQHLQHIPVGLVFGDNKYSFSFTHLVNDGLMAVFFLMVGLEIKRELLIGELSSRQQMLLPLVAAVGGMLFPALIYSAFNWGDAAAMRGWAIPTATDIAFSLGVLSLLGSRVPLSIKVFLTAVAIIDDLGAIAIIAVFYTGDLNYGAIGAALFVIFILAMMNRYVTTVSPYMIAFIVLWACMIQSGIHATLAGVAVAFAIPLRMKRPDTRSTLLTLEHNLHAAVTFLIIPLFAFVNAGVNLQDASWQLLANDIPLGIATGLFFGKAIGITLFIWLSVKFGIASLPHGCRWPGIIGVSMLCGIGFTVSLFIGNLSFTDPELINLVKIGVLLGSALSGIAGFILLRYGAFKHPQKD